MTHTRSSRGPEPGGSPAPPGVWRRAEVAAFRLLLRAYGRPFRDRYGKELLRFFEQDRARHTGVRGSLRFWRRTLADLGAAALKDRSSTVPWKPTLMISDLGLDVRVAARTLRKTPSATLAAVTTLAVGIAATTVVFTIVNAALIESMPFEDADGLVRVQGTLRSDRGDVRAASYVEIGEWRQGAGSFESLAAYDPVALDLVTDDIAERVGAEIVEPAYFDVMRARIIVGRTFRAGENVTRGAHPVAIISEGLWQRRFNRDPSLVDSRISVNGVEVVVVGVLAEPFAGLSLQAEIWVPTMMADLIGRGRSLEERDQRWMSAIGRLRPGASLVAAQAELDAVAVALESEYPQEHLDRTGTIRPLRDAYLGTARELLIALLVAAALLLVVAAANVSGLLLVRGSQRSGEMSLRRALGSGSARLVRLQLVESIMLASLGTLVGIGMSYWLLGLVVAWLPQGALPAWVDLRLDGGTLAFALLALGLTALAAGTLPALRHVGAATSGALRGDRVTDADDGWLAPRRLLVVTEVAVALVLVIGTGLMVRTFAAKLAVDPGFDPEGARAFRLRLPAERYEGDARRAFLDGLAARLRGTPGVEDVTYGSDLPLRGNAAASFLLLDPDAEEQIRHYVHRVPPGFLPSLGVRLLQGRDFSAVDADGAAEVAIVSREMAERYFPGGALGEMFWWRPEEPPATIVGVVETVRWRDLTTDLAADDSNPDVYFPIAQYDSRAVDFLVRGRGDDDELLQTIRREVAALDAGLPIIGVARLDVGLELQTALDRLAALVLAIFGASALIVAAIGVYGALAYSVERRKREIAIRLALGASPRQVRGGVLGNGVTMAALGVGIGVIAALGATRTLGSLLYGVSSGDPLTYAVGLGLMGVVALISAWLPAMRATRVTPHEALKAD